MSVIIVARAGLGTINQTVLTVKYIETLGIKIKGIIVNNYIDNMLCRDNIQMIEKLTKVPVIAKLGHIEDLNDNMVQAIRINAKESFSISTIEACMEEL